ncbi:MAG: S8 family peptidase [Alphaproteobacteria bacterium]|nr:S8 family peptidase [Alphaproteobacteria bacterium]
MTKRNFLIGKGERLAEDITGVRGGGPKSAPYTFGEARARLTPKLTSAVNQIDALPPEACPNDQAIISVTLNPEYIAKSYFPQDLFTAAGVTAVGSKPRKIKPEKRSRDRAPEEAITTELYVLGSRDALRRWSQRLPTWQEDERGGRDLLALEDITAPTPETKIKGHLPSAARGLFEVVLHTDALRGEVTVLPEFRKYLKHLGVEAALDKRFYAGGLCFLEVEAPTEFTDEIATFSIVRAIREMPRLRMLRPTIRATDIPTQSIILPDQEALDENIRVAIFDGGIPAGHPLTTWVRPIETANLGAPHPEFLKHGVHVTSAFLFGSIDPRARLRQPYANVDHYRVLDNAPGQNAHELYEVLERIDKVLSDETYDFVNLSLGPQLPIEDDDVHAWTAVLDDRFGLTNTLAAVAVGNDGEGDSALGLNRIQVPADCVNALAVGACDTPGENWLRAPYSSVGPGRSPGLMKPDLVEFGGSLQRPFLVVGDNIPEPKLDATGGTSFATPSALRIGAGVRAHFGSSLGMLAIRALMIHCAEKTEHPPEQVGWGRVARDLEDIVICDDDTIRVVYQGTISPAKYIRAPIPMPSETIKGNAEITATICYKCRTDPHHPGNYTRAGLEIAFRPHDQKFSREDQVYANTKSFFGAANRGMTEEELRRDAWKWENCMHATKTLRGTSLRNPCFDIHYNARLEGRNFAPDEPLTYALIVSVKAKHISDLYDQVIRKYATLLEPLRPTIDIPVRT